MTDINTMKDFVSAIRETKSGTKPYDTTATVVKTEGSTAWVHIPGGIDETPVQMSIDAKVGDSVNVRVSGGHAWITGNTSRPPTDDATAIVAQETAEVAQETAEEAQATAQATRNYFWHDADGAHVSTVEGDASTGKNVLIDSDSIELRDGTDVVASFEENEITLGQDDAVIELCGGVGSMHQTSDASEHKLYLTLDPTAADAGKALTLLMDTHGEDVLANGAKVYLTSNIQNDGTLGSSSVSVFGTNTVQLRCDTVFNQVNAGSLINLAFRLDMGTMTLYPVIQIVADKIELTGDVTANGNGLVPIVNGDETTDLNNCTETGIYIYTSAASHTPNAAGGSLLVMKTSSSYIKQIAMPNNSGGTASVYARIHYASGWGSWKTL